MQSVTTVLIRCYVNPPTQRQFMESLSSNTVVPRWIECYNFLEINSYNVLGQLLFKGDAIHTL